MQRKNCAILVRYSGSRFHPYYLHPAPMFTTLSSGRVITTMWLPSAQICTRYAIVALGQKRSQQLVHETIINVKGKTRGCHFQLLLLNDVLVLRVEQNSRSQPCLISLRIKRNMPYPQARRRYLQSRPFCHGDIVHWGIESQKKGLKPKGACHPTLV